MDANKNPKSRLQFGNMAKASGQGFKRNRRTLAWIGGGVLVVGVLAFAAMRFRPHSAAKASLAEATKRAKREPKAWQAQRELGHSQFAAGQHALALKSYERALKLNDEAADGRMVDNLVKCYRTPEQGEAAQLIVQYKMVDATKDLEALSRDKAFATRWASLDTLEKLGKVKRADLLQAWHRDLEDSAASCDARRRAVEMIGDYDTGKEVVAELRAAKKKDQAQTPWYKRSCLGSRTDDAEKKILARSPTKRAEADKPAKKVLARR